MIILLFLLHTFLVQASSLEQTTMFPTKKPITAEYEVYVYQKKCNYTIDGLFDKIIYESGKNISIELKIYDKENTEIKFEETIIYSDNYVTSFVIANPAVRYTDPPESKIHTYFIKEDLSVGSETYLPLEWIKCHINNTIREVILGYNRDVNIINVSKKILSNHNYFECYDQFSKYDKKTGILLYLEKNYNKTYYYENGNISEVYIEIHRYNIKSTNVWSKTYNFFYLIIPFSSLLIWYLYIKKGKVIMALYSDLSRIVCK